MRIKKNQNMFEAGYTSKFVSYVSDEDNSSFKLSVQKISILRGFFSFATPI